MRKVFSSASEVIHVFAQRTQSEGRSGNVFFENATYSGPEDVRLYSYGRHYELARFIKGKDGSEAVLINDKGYSSSTSKHICWTRQATRDKKQFFTTLTETSLVFDSLKKNGLSLANANKPEKYIEEADYLFARYSEFCDWSGIKPEKEIVSLMNKVFKSEDPKTAANKVFKKEVKARNEAKKREAQRAKERAAQNKAIAVEREKRYKETSEETAARHLQEFRSYKRSRIEVKNDDDQDRLRLSKNGKNVETSQHISVSVEAAKLLYTLIKAGRDIKGHNIEGYTVISINGTLKIGCHAINMEDVVSIGEQLLKK
jgi:hypothetical protein